MIQSKLLIKDKIDNNFISKIKPNFFLFRDPFKFKLIKVSFDKTGLNQP